MAVDPGSPVEVNPAPLSKYRAFILLEIENGMVHIPPGPAAAGLGALPTLLSAFRRGRHASCIRRKDLNVILFQKVTVFHSWELFQHDSTYDFLAIRAK